MTLKTKTITFSTVLLTLCFSVLYVSARTVLGRSFFQLEERETSTNVERATNALTAVVSALSGLTREWGAWDDAYAFVEDGNEAFRTSNLNDENVAQMGVDLVLYVHRSGRVTFGQQFDKREKKFKPMPEGFRQYLAKNPGLVTHSRLTASIEGLLILPEGPLLFASRPVTKSDLQGDIRGAVVLGKFLDQAGMELLSATTKLSLAVRAVADRSKPSDFEDAARRLATGRSAVILPQSDEAISGYGLVKSYDGGPGIILRVTSKREIHQEGNKAVKYFGLSLALLAAVVVGCSAVGIGRLSRHITGAVRNLQESSARVKAASERFSSASSELTSGTEVQATSFDQISEALEHLLELARNNADRASVSGEQMKRIAASEIEASKSLEWLISSIDSIRESSEKSQAIVKTIHQIAFQTNLLALNAAVEAARAGQAGAGFAVVADEVRSLAQKSAEAANDTASLLEVSAAEVREGTAKAATAGEAFTRTASANAEARSRVREIAGASGNQLKAAEEIRSAVRQAAGVTRSNAAAAEATAAASAQMLNDAAGLLQVVAQLTELIGDQAGTRSGLVST